MSNLWKYHTVHNNVLHSLRSSDAYMCQENMTLLVQIMACHLIRAKLSEPMLGYFYGPLGTNFSEISIEMLTFSFKKMHLKSSSVKWRPFCISLNVLKLSSVLYVLNYMLPYPFHWMGKILKGPLYGKTQKWPVWPLGVSYSPLWQKGH